VILHSELDRVDQEPDVILVNRWNSVKMFRINHCLP